MKKKMVTCVSEDFILLAYDMSIIMFLKLNWELATFLRLNSVPSSGTLEEITFSKIQRPLSQLK